MIKIKGVGKNSGYHFDICREGYRRKIKASADYSPEVLILYQFMKGKAVSAALDRLR